MDENRIEGAVKEGVGHVQEAFGGLTGDRRAQGKGELNEAAGQVQQAYGRAMDQAREVARDVGDQARVIAERTKDRIGDQPWTAVGVAAVGGLILGLLLNGGHGGRIVYVKPTSR